MRFRYFHRPHRGREIAARGHPVPDLIQIAPQILRELLDRAAIHSRRALIGLDLLPCPHTSHFEISNDFPDDFSSSTRLLPGLRLVDRTNTATDDPAPSLRPHYRSFVTTTGRSAGESRTGTRSLTVSAAWDTPFLHPCWAQLSGPAFPRSTRKQQIRLASPPCRAPPGQ